MPHDAGTARTETGETSLTKWQLLAFAIPAIPISAMGLPLVVYLPPFYAELGLGTGIVGSLFMFARFWDVFTDPVLGILSDRFETRWGRRRHWIVISVPIMMVSRITPAPSGSRASSSCATSAADDAEPAAQRHAAHCTDPPVEYLPAPQSLHCPLGVDAPAPDAVPGLQLVLAH